MRRSTRPFGTSSPGSSAKDASVLSAAAYAAPQARVRARRSGLLTDAAWRGLLEATSSGELATAFEATPYASDVVGDEVGIEQALISRVAQGGHALLRSLQGRPRDLVAWYLRRFDLDNLKTVLRTIHHHQDRERARALLLRFEGSTLDWEALLDAGSIAVLIDRLRATPYARPLELALERYQEEQLPFYLEVSLDLAFFQRLVRLTERLGGTDRRQTERLLGFWIATRNLLWAYRYRVYARMSPEEIVNYTLHRAYAVDVAAVRRVATGAPISEEARRVGVDIPAELAPRDALARFETLARRALFARAQSSFRGWLFHLGAVLAYLVLLETEVRDLITVVEGKAQGLAATELASRLIREVPGVRA